MVQSSLKRKADEAYFVDGKKSLIEVPLLYEANWQDQFALVVVVSVSEQIASKRAFDRDGVSFEQIKKAISAQVPLKKKALLADYVVNNNKSLNDTVKQLVELKKNLDTLNLTA